MTEIWAGDILVDGLPTNIKDVHFWNTSKTSTNILPPNAALRFLSNVHVPTIPLCLPAGPSLEVSTDNADTATWLSDRLNAEGNCVRGDLGNDSSEPWWSDASRQLDIGVLLGVEGFKQEGNATEILLYAKVEKLQQDLPTSRCSSPTMLSDSALHDLRTAPVIKVEVCALPLCSDILTKARKASDSNRAGLAMLTTSTFLQHGQVGKPSMRKRQKMSDLFDDATQQRRKLKGRGGEAVSKAVFDAEQTTSQQGRTSLPGQEEIIRGPNGTRKHLSNASDAGSLPNTEMRPVSHSGLANGKRSSLRRAESALSPRQASVLSDSDSGFTLQNKAALTKMVMAGMRLHGLQQRKKGLSLSDKPGLSHQNTLLSGIESLNDGEDDYKLIYHQTFRAAMFTFRAYFSERILGQNVMRDVVDRLLLLFCADPLSPVNHQHGFLQVHGAQQEEVNTLYSPSSIAPVEPPAGGEWSTPPTKRRR